MYSIANPQPYESYQFSDVRNKSYFEVLTDLLKLLLYVDWIEVEEG